MNIEELQIMDTFTGLDTRFQLWEQILGRVGVEVVAEIGVWKGSFAKYILERCEGITHLLHDRSLGNPAKLEQTL